MSAGNSRRDQRGKLLGHIGPHAVIASPRAPPSRRRRSRRPGRSPIALGSSGTSVAARAGVRRDEDQAVLGAGGAILALLGDVGVRAGQARQIPDHRQLPALLRLRRQEDREGHVGPGRRGRMLTTQLPPAMRLVLADDLQAHLRRSREVRTACCRPDRADRRDTSCRSRRRGCPADPRSTCRRRRARRMPGIDFLGARRLEADRGAVAVAARLAVERLTDTKTRRRGSSTSRTCQVLRPACRAHRTWRRRTCRDRSRSLQPSIT